MNIPAELKYTKDHEWVKIDGDIATVGITQFAQGELGDIVYVDVDTLDDEVEKDEVFGSVESFFDIEKESPIKFSTFKKPRNFVKKIIDKISK